MPPRLISGTILVLFSKFLVLFSNFLVLFSRFLVPFSKFLVLFSRFIGQVRLGQVRLGQVRLGQVRLHPLLKTTLTGLRRTYLRFLVFRPKLTKTKRFPPFLDHMNGKLFLGGSRFWSGKIGPKLAVGGHRSQCPAELSFIFNRCPAGYPLFLTDKIFF